MIYQLRPSSNTFYKVKRAFGNPVSPLKPNPRFIPFPPGKSAPADLSYNLSSILTPQQFNAIEAAGKIVFHTVGDTGGVSGTQIQDEIAGQMEKQYEVTDPAAVPVFFFILGDVIYYNGLSTDYPQQFYEPYQYYPAPIFAIPGNHDGDTSVRANDPPDHEPSLTGFFENFCAPQRQPGGNSPYRYTMNQPWPYWTLNMPFATIIGLYSNVDGSLDDVTGNNQAQPQYQWFVKQLKNTDPNKCLILTIHHPPFSLDTVHGGYQDILDAIDQASAEAGRYPDIVFSGHVHNYQRYTRTINKAAYPYVVAGAGGYANTAKSLHHMQADPKTSDGHIPVPFKTTCPDVVLAHYNTSSPGFLRITIDKQTLKGEYFINTFDNTAPPATPDDVFTLNWKKHTVS